MTEYRLFWFVADNQRCSFDAAIATALVLSVIRNQSTGSGGGGFMVLRTYEGGVAALDYRANAPAAADRDMYLDEAGDVVPGLSTKGHLAAGVPGTVAGMELAWKRYGSKKVKWSELLAPAIRLAEEGFILDASFPTTLYKEQKQYLKYPSSKVLFLLNVH